MQGKVVLCVGTYWTVDVFVVPVRGPVNGMAWLLFNIDQSSDPENRYL
jgi:hypothetical protein